jgi:hypothetical protein
MLGESLSDVLYVLGGSPPSRVMVTFKFRMLGGEPLRFEPPPRGGMMSLFSKESILVAQKVIH